MKNSLLVLLILLLTIYAPIALSWRIVGWGLTPKLIFELVFMWSFYIGVITIIFVITRRRKRRF